MAALKATRLWMGSLLICSWAASVQADGMCEKNEDCPKGFTCTTTSGTTTPECAAPCKMGDACETPPECKQPVEWRECTPAACETDADCGDNAVCYTQTISECSGGTVAACPPGEMCPQPEPAPEPSCTERTIKECYARYLLPCQQDSDCGGGFTCEAGEECSCSGSAGGADARPADADAGTAMFAPVPPAKDGGAEQSPTCECHPTELKYCELKEIACSADSDCPSEFVCVSDGDNAVSCGAAPSDGDAAKGVACEPVPQPTAAKHCEPRGGLGAPGTDKGTDGPIYGEGGSMSAPHEDGDSSDAGVAPELPVPASGSSSCSVSAPRVGTTGSLLAPLSMMLAALGVGLRRKRR